MPAIAPMPRKDAILKIRLPDELKRDIEAIAENRGESVAVIVREAMRLYMENHPELPRSTGSYDTINPLQSMPRAAEEGKEYLPGASDAPPGTGSRSANG